jgi:hypothetical protein
MPTASVPVFISYHEADYAIAHKMRSCLGALSAKFNVFLDKTSIGPGDDYRKVISEELKKAQWFLIICTGFPRSDSDMAWPFFEAGQFSATLPDNLIVHASKRMVCLYDIAPPSILAPLLGVKVTSKQKGGAQIDLASEPVADNAQFDDTFIFDLFYAMLENAPLDALRDVAEDSVKESIRAQCREMIKVFDSAVPTSPVEDKPLQPRISYEIKPGQLHLENDTVVTGYNDSLDILFSIAKPETTWGKIIEACCNTDDAKPLWIVEAEAASALISKDMTPPGSTAKGYLKGQVYRAFTARYEVFKDRRKTVYVVFLPSASKTFDLKHGMGLILSALILCVRFRDQLIPLADDLSDPDNDKCLLLNLFYQRLRAAEIEALQFGLRGDHESLPSETPLLTVIEDAERRRKMRQLMSNWRKHRKEIGVIFADTSDLHTNTDLYAAKIINILKETKESNAYFISALIAELSLSSSG